MMTPLTHYNELINQDLIAKDPDQYIVLLNLEETFYLLLSEHKKRSSILGRIRKKQALIGHYIYGGVGIGKTFLMDCFFQTLPFTNKRRLHFHQFMSEVHALLKKFQGQENPLNLAAKAIANEAMVLCLDELLVTDVTDAMILLRLFKALYTYGVTLIITSNVAPDDLYKNGLQRLTFLPAIAFIKEHNKVLEVKISCDYRLKHLQKAGVFFVPPDEMAIEEMEKCFQLLSSNEAFSRDPIALYERTIPIIRRASNCIWFDFNVICSPPRSQHDYLTIAKNYQSVFISNIPKIHANQKDIIMLFIRMIDVFYDAKVRLICSSMEHPDQIYTSGHAMADYQRTQSRLMDMQSLHYFSSGGI